MDRENDPMLFIFMDIRHWNLLPEFQTDSRDLRCEFTLSDADHN